MDPDERAAGLFDEQSDGEDVFPDYGGYCVAGVPGSCLSALGERPETVPTLPGDVFEGVDHAEIDTVVLVLIDGFGFDQWRRIERDDAYDTSLLGSVTEAGNLTSLTSIYPSETAAAIPTLHSGRYAREHGLLGWWQYVEDIGSAVQTLPYMTAADEPVLDIYPEAPEPAGELFEPDPIYEHVVNDLDVRLFEPSEISEKRDAFSARADEYVPCGNVAHLATNLRRAIETANRPAYYYAYVPKVDEYGHHYGPDAPETLGQVESILGALERELLGRLDGAEAERTLLVLTADHGHVDTGGENVDIRDYDPIWDHLETGPDGEPIPPVGSARNLQLHLEDGAVDRVRRTLEEDFDCWTFTREEYEERGLFGPGEPGDVFERHAPDLVCVHREKGMWYSDDTLEKHGKHGGLTREEMLVPFAAARLDRLGRST